MRQLLSSTTAFCKNSPLADVLGRTRGESLPPLVRIPKDLRNTGPRRLVLHVGAHKTGTTSLQTLLRRVGDQLATQGICAFARHVPRTPWSTIKSGYAGYLELIRPNTKSMRKAPDGSIEQYEAARAFAKILEAVAHSAPTIVYSDEALLGPRVKNRKGLYSSAKRQLQTVMEHFPERKVSVILYIRDQVDYVETSYLQGLKEGLVTLPFDQFIEKYVHLDKLSWLDLADRIASVVGPEALSVERFERIADGGFVPFARRFLDRFADSSRFTIEKIQKNPSFSPVGADLALAIRPHVSSERWKLYRKLLSKDFTRKEHQQPPKLFSEMQKADLRQLYEGDCEAAEEKYSRLQF